MTRLTTNELSPSAGDKNGVRDTYVGEVASLCLWLPVVGSPMPCHLPQLFVGLFLRGRARKVTMMSYTVQDEATPAWDYATTTRP